MDGLSVAASVIAVVEIAMKVAVAASQYGSSVKNYPKSLDNLNWELKMMNENLENLRSLLESNPESSYAYLGVENGPLDRCGKSLLELFETFEKFLGHGSASRAKRIKAKLRRYIWPLKEKEIKEYIATFQNYTGQFNLGVGIDTKLVIAPSISSEILSRS
jgi:hypothetical protein